MKTYHKMLRRLNSHPKIALDQIRRLQKYRRQCCLRCGCIGHLETHHTDQRGIKTYLCRDCGKTFTELQGTIFYRSKIPLSIWLIVLLEWVLSTGSISAAEVARKTGLSHKSSWQMLMKMRHFFGSSPPKELLNGITEIDESWHGKKENQDIVFGLVERIRNQVRFIFISNTKETTIRTAVFSSVKKRSVFMTDGATYYGFASVSYEKNSVNHSKHEFARVGGIHTNTIEHIWGDIKGIIRTTHHGISKKYRQLYFAQYAFRYNYKKCYDLFVLSLFIFLFPSFSPTYSLI